ncbi:MAG: hypothetical protein QNJ22_17885 [Desulfosarcinaceae bacterium]|nr:hypothetical protein [Desulfosarcinaceae bacterium]
MELSDDQIREMVNGYLEHEKEKLINTPVKLLSFGIMPQSSRIMRAYKVDVSTLRCKKNPINFITTGDYQYVEERVVKLLSEFGVDAAAILYRKSE